MNNSFILRRILFFYQKINPIPSISSSSLSKNIYFTMKKLLDDKQYKQVLDLFDKQSNSCTDGVIDMAIKACIHLNEHQRIIDIEKKLLPTSLNNPYIQTALVQFYSK